MINKTTILISILFLLTSFLGSNGKLERQGKDYAIFFAVKDYQNWEDLRTPIKDAKAIAKVLEKEYDFETEILENPTKRTIRKKIAALQKKKFNKEDQLLLFFTGHGEFVPSSYDPDEGKGYFIPADAKKNDEFRESYLYYPDVKPDINDIACEHILIVIDACFSGSFLKYRTGDERPGKLNERDLLIENSMEKRCRKGITSGGLKRTQDGYYHSPFTNNFLSGLNTLGGEDRVLTYNELFVQLTDPSNEPQRGYFGYEDRDSKFLFIAKRKKTDKESWQIKEHRKLDLREWTKAEQDNTIDAYSNYLSYFRTGIYALKAYQKIEELENEIDEVNYFADSSGTFVDRRDGQRYSWKKMKDGKVWMTENLNYKMTNSYCYNDKESNCEKYGRLYKLAVAKEACPIGWHLPIQLEWDNIIFIYKRDNEVISDKLSILMGGNRSFEGDFQKLGEGYYWAADNNGVISPCYYFSKTEASRNYEPSPSALSCRCIKD